jgi:hypothetical protein
MIGWTKTCTTHYVSFCLDWFYMLDDIEDLSIADIPDVAIEVAKHLVLPKGWTLESMVMRNLLYSADCDLFNFECEHFPTYLEKQTVASEMSSIVKNLITKTLNEKHNS